MIQTNKNEPIYQNQQGYNPNYYPYGQFTAEATQPNSLNYYNSYEEHQYQQSGPFDHLLHTEYTRGKPIPNRA